MKLIDFIIIFIVFFISFNLIFTHKKKTSGGIAEVKTPNRIYRIRLNKDRIMTIKGKLGFLKLEVKSGKIRVLDSPCPKKICINTGWISKPGQMIVCIPNRVIIKILGSEKKGEVDFFTY